MTPQVYSLRAAHRRIDPVPDGAIYVGRQSRGRSGSRWANPFTMQHESDRPTVINLFIDYIVAILPNEPTLLEPLKGNDLVCWCHGPTPGNGDRPCHADILLFLANDPTCIQCGRPLDITQLSEQNFRKCPGCAQKQGAA